jgi:hypothetical protein
MCVRVRVCVCVCVCMKFLPLLVQFHIRNLEINYIHVVKFVLLTINVHLRNTLML